MMSVIYLVNLLFQVFTMMLIVRIVASWLPQLNEYRIMHFIRYYTDPYLNIFRRIIPPLGMIDFSPIVAFLCLGFIQNLIINLLLGLAA
jgi:YggT family protein